MWPLFLVFYPYNIKKPQSLKYFNLGYLILIAGFIFGTKAYRDSELNGHISYGKALGYSIIILLVASIISTIYGYIFMNFIELIRASDLRTAAWLQRKIDNRVAHNIGNDVLKLKPIVNQAKCR